MTEFPSLEEFLLMKDPTDRYGRSIHSHDMLPEAWRRGLTPAQDMVFRYRLAKKNWELCGDAGPPIGSKVITLRAGYGGGGGLIRVVSHLNKDTRFLTLIEPKPVHERLSELGYLLSVHHWWVEVCMFPEGGNAWDFIEKFILSQLRLDEPHRTGWA